jgi:hypothetical protein
MLEGNFYIFRIHRKLVLKKLFMYLLTLVLIEIIEHANLVSLYFHYMYQLVLDIFL